MGVESMLQAISKNNFKMACMTPDMLTYLPAPSARKS